MHVTSTCPVFFLIPSLEVCRNAIFIVRFLWHYFRLLLTGRKSERGLNSLDMCMGLTKLLSRTMFSSKISSYDRSKHLKPWWSNIKRYSILEIDSRNDRAFGKVLKFGSVSQWPHLLSDSLKLRVNLDWMPPSQLSLYWRVWELNEAFSLCGWLS